MQNRSQTKTFTVPLGVEAHSIAEQFRRKHRHGKAKQVYINTLAVSAVKFYLRCMGWDTNWEASFSYNPVMQSLMDVADLQVVGLGKLECFPVLPAQTVYIPSVACSERIGYVAVQLSESLKVATLLGFVTTAAVEGEILLNELRSLEDLLMHLHQIKQVESVKEPVKLNKWFENLFETSWQSLEVIFAAMDQRKLAYRSMPSFGKASIARAKLIDMGLQLGSQSVALLVALAPYYDHKIEISVQLHPVEGETYLPPLLKMTLLSESGEIFQEVQSRSHDNYIQLKRFRGYSGESFKIQVALGNVIIIENFVI